MVLQTKNVMTRPYCLMEIYHAIVKRVPIVAVNVLAHPNQVIYLTTSSLPCTLQPQSVYCPRPPTQRYDFEATALFLRHLEVITKTEPNRTR